MTNHTNLKHVMLIYYIVLYSKYRLLNINKYRTLSDNVGNQLILSFIKYRILRFRKVTRNKLYVLVRYLLFLYLGFKMKLGWY